ncbi:hypothetical protein D9M71_493120 [compost metagenome]
MANPSVIAIFVDETLATLIDENTFYQRFGGIERQALKSLVHVNRRAPHAHPQEDARTVIARRSYGVIGAQQERRVALDHVTVHREAAGAQDDAVAGPYKTDLAVDSHHHPVDVVGVIGNQGEHPAVIANIHAEFLDASGQHVHQHASAAPAGPLRGMSAGAGLGLLRERPGFFATGPDQAVVRLRLQHFFRQERVLVLDPLCDQPLIVAKTILRIQPYFRFIGVDTASHHQVTEKVFGIVVKAGLSLSGRAAAATKIDFTPG